MYQFVRIVLFMVLSLCPLIFILRHYPHNRKAKTLGIAVVFAAAVITLISAAYPIENLFVSFQTPEDAFEYRTHLTAEHVIYGQDSSMVFGRKANEPLAEFVIPRSESGWKLGSDNDLSICYGMRPFDGFYITVERFRDTDDYYISILDSTQTDKNITDKNGTSFFKGYQDKDSCSYYAYVNRFDMDYYIIVNGVQIKMNK